MAHGPDDSDDEQESAASAAGAPASTEEWIGRLAAQVRQCAAYGEHRDLLEECIQICCVWQQRFSERQALWSRIRRGGRLAKELAESAPVLARARTEALALQAAGPSPRLVVIDLCSGFGYLGMFLSELLPAEFVEKIVLVDVRWAPHSVERQPHHLNPEHLDDPDWPIRLTTSRCNLKSPSDRRGLAHTFLTKGQPTLLLGVHLCGTLSLRAVELFNTSPCIALLALKPCCLPPLDLAQRGEVFALGAHSFPASAVCAAGQWKRNRWVGPSGKEEVERKYHVWVDNLCMGCDADDGVDGEDASRAAVEVHRVQRSWFLNKFVFCSRRWGAGPPASLARPPPDAADGQQQQGGAAPPRQTREEVLARWRAQRHADKLERRRARREAAAAAAASGAAAVT